MNHLESVLELMKKTKEVNPLVDFVTNYVTANDLTTIATYVGGAPVMTDDPVDAADVIEYGNVDAVVFNIGTITEVYLEAMIEACKKAREKGIPVILDPVATSITPFRTKAVQRILDEGGVTIIKGNLGEIKGCLGLKPKSKGVDSNEDETGAEKYCIELAKKRNAVVAMTGKEDIITDGERVVKIKNGTSRLPMVIGTGCMIGAMIAAFSGATNDHFYAALTGTMLMGIAGEIAEEKLKEGDGHGVFKNHLLDRLSIISEDDVRDKAKIVDISEESKRHFERTV